MVSLKGKVICVTGAASGIGLATAKVLFTQGAMLSLLDLREESLEAAVAGILGDSTESDRIIFTAVDIRSSDQVDAWVERTVKHFGCLDGAANIAGVIGRHYGIHDISELSNEEWDFINGTNLTGLFYCLRAQINAICDGGSIVNTSSVVGLEGHGKNGAYSASKHGVIGLTKSAAQEVGSRGIRVNSIAPGIINTPMINSFGAVSSGKLDVFARVPLARVCEPGETYVGTDNKAGNAACVVFIFIFISVYRFFIDPPQFVFVSEIFPTTIRAKGIGIAFFAYFFGAITYTAPAAVAFKNIGWGMYMVWFSVTCISSVLIYFFIPETKGLALEEIGEIFGDAVAIHLTSDQRGIIEAGSEASGYARDEKTGSVEENTVHLEATNGRSKPSGL